MSFWSKFARSGRPPAIADIYRAPAHLIRRCHQISVAIFAEHLGSYTLTPIQYASLMAIHDRPGMEQGILGQVIAIDRSTIGSVVRSLEIKGYVERRTPSDNMRVKQLWLTQNGERLLLRTVSDIASVQQKILSPLSPSEQRQFMALLSKLVDTNNESSRAPLRRQNDVDARR
jgi:DNA-binding MarR family transcriptional regulator